LIVPFLVYIMAGTKEEKKHQIYKNGAKSANPIDSEKQLVRRDVIISTLRYIIHGGGIGPADGVVLTKAFSTFSHPRNQHAPHPILEKLTSYLSNTHFQCYPRKFLYLKGSRVTTTLSDDDAKAVAGLLKRTVSPVVLKSKQLVVDEKPFALGDHVSVVAGTGKPDERFGIFFLTFFQNFPLSDLMLSFFSGGS